MKTMIHKAVSTMTMFFLAGALMTTIAQGTVDIGLFQNGSDQLEVRVRPNVAFEGIVSSMVFSIRWDVNTGATLGAPIQTADVTPYMLASKSGAKHEDGHNNYQIYAGFGTQPMSAFGVNWEAGQEYVVMTIPVDGAAEFELINNSWTAELSHNGNYYLALGGRDATGIIYKSLSTMSSLSGSVTIQPNPNNGLFDLSFFAPEKMNIEIEIVNTLGQRIFGEKLSDFSGRYAKEMDISNESNGVYYVKLNDGTDTSVHKVVYR